MKGKTQRYYDANPEAKRKKLRYQAKYNARPEERQRRSELVMLNRKMGTKGDGKDVSHTKGGKVVLEAAKRNRARNGTAKGRRKSYRANTKK